MWIFKRIPLPLIVFASITFSDAEDYVIPIAANGIVGEYRFVLSINYLTSRSPKDVSFRGYDDGGGPIGVGCDINPTSSVGIGGSGGNSIYGVQDACVTFNDPEYG